MSNAALQLLEKAKKQGEWAEVVFNTSREREVGFEFSSLKYRQEDLSSSLGLRIVVDGRIGVSGTNNLEKWEELADKAAASARFGPRYQAGYAGTSGAQPTVKTNHEETSKVKSDQLVKQGREVVEEFKQFNPDIYTNINLNTGYGKTKIINTNGLEVEKEGTMFDYTASWDLVEEGNMLEIWAGQTARRINDIDIAKYSKEGREKFKWAEQKADAGSGKQTVVFTPRAFSSLLSYITRALNGRNVLKNVSLFGDKLGKRIFDPRISIYDNGLIDWAAGSKKCDSEGTAVRPLCLVKEGVVKNFYTDLWTAGRLGIEPTGHGSRGIYDALAEPRLHNIVVQGATTVRHSDASTPRHPDESQDLNTVNASPIPGQARNDEEGARNDGGGVAATHASPGAACRAATAPGAAVQGGIIKRVDNGILADQFLGAGQDNPYSGDFSMNLNLGYKIKNGEIIGRVKDTMIAGNVFELLRNNVLEVSAEREWVDGDKLLPWIVLGGVTVS